VQHLIERKARELKIGDTPELAPGAIDDLMAYDWPGNVRELENEMERAVLLSDPGEPISAASLSEFFVSDPPLASTTTSAPTGSEDGTDGGGLRDRTDAFERKEIQAALGRNEEKKARAARALGITYQGLLKKMRRLGMME
jgi:DNA-binding NtrC family response regulator